MEHSAWSALTETRTRVLLDTNVVLDWLLDRKPWSDEAQPIWQALAANTLMVYFSASALTDVFYIVRHQQDTIRARRAVSDLLWAFRIVSVGKVILMRANHLPGDDFEDNVVIACAEIEQVGYIITRDLKGFQHSSIKAMDPKTFVNLLQTP